jgi:hypothetical protein
VGNTYSIDPTEAAFGVVARWRGDADAVVCLALPAAGRLVARATMNNFNSFSLVLASRADSHQNIKTTMA